MRKEKICPVCLQEYFNRGSKCTPCWNKEYYILNKDKIRLKKQEYYRLNKDNIDAKCQLYTDKNKDKVKAKNRKHYHKNKDVILSYQKSIRHTPKRKYGQAVKSARDRNLIWDIDFTSYVEIISNPCHYCGDSLEKFGGSSLDRMNNLVGYTLTNVLPCCGSCNNIRNNFLTVKEMEVAMTAVVQFRKGDIK